MFNLGQSEDQLSCKGMSTGRELRKPESGHSFNLSEPQFTCVKNGDNNTPDSGSRFQ